MCNQTKESTEENSMDIHLVVFSYSEKQALQWLKRHSIYKPFTGPVKLIILIEEALTGASPLKKIANHLAHSLSIYNRVLLLQNLVGPDDLLIPCASDDTISNLDLFQVSTEFNDPKLGLLAPKTKMGNKYALSNSICNGSFKRETSEQLVHYLTPPLPADNSIFYGVFRFKSWIDCYLWADELVGTGQSSNFHAFDWLFMARVIDQISKSAGYVKTGHGIFELIRTPNPWSKYHDEYGNDFCIATSHPLIPLIRVLLSEYPSYDLDGPLLSWFNIKVSEMCQLKGVPIPVDTHGLYMEIFH